MPAVFRLQVFSLIRRLCRRVLTPLPFLWGILTRVLLALRDDGSLLEQGHGRSDTFIEVFLVDEGPVSIARLLSDLKAFENLLFVGLECGELFWGEDIGGAMENKQFHQL